MRLRRSAVALLRASHPEPSAAVTLAAVALAAVAGRSPAGLVAVGAAMLAGQLSIGWLNDYLDADRDRAVGRPDKPVAAGAISRRGVGVAAVIAVVLCVPLSLLSGVPAGSAHLLAVASGWAYDLWLKSTVVSVLPYGVSFGLLPAFVTLGLPGHPLPAGWLVAAAALLGSAAHFANVLPDLRDDAVTGVRGLPHRLGLRGSQVAGALLLLASSAVLALGPPGPPSLLGLAVLAVAAGVLVAGYLLGRRPGSRAPFRAMLVVALLNVLALVAAGSQPTAPAAAGQPVRTAAGGPVGRVGRWAGGPVGRWVGGRASGTEPTGTAARWRAQHGGRHGASATTVVLNSRVSAARPRP